jgi:hypothetical protein
MGEVRRGGCVLDFHIVRGQEGAVLLEVEEGEVAVEGRWGVLVGLGREILGNSPRSR